LVNQGDEFTTPITDTELKRREIIIGIVSAIPPVVFGLTLLALLLRIKKKKTTDGF
jgi:hypothetical protein